MNSATNIAHIYSIGKGKGRQDYSRKSGKEIYLFEIKRVRRITLFSGNELATVPIAVGCIALLVRVTLINIEIVFLIVYILP